ncbi:MAG: 4Fe-4S binding protein [Sedimenticolaceae bacterium]
MVARKMTTSQWHRFFAAAAPVVTGPAISRRNFLRTALTAVTEPGVVEKPLEWQAPGSALPRAGAGGLAFFAPRLDAALCNGCDACTRVCPHHVLRLAERGDAYEIHADACTGCGLCADVCDQHAMSVEVCSAVKDSRVSLQLGSCRACGANFHRPALDSAAADQTLCQICAQTRYHRNLFQVI